MNAIAHEHAVPAWPPAARKRLIWVGLGWVLVAALEAAAYTALAWAIARHHAPTPVLVCAAIAIVATVLVQLGGFFSGTRLAGDLYAALGAALARARLSWFTDARRARIAALAVTGLDPSVMGLGPVSAIRLLLARSRLQMDDIARFEINEAQGGQVLACARELGIGLDRLNVHGGAIALGHPLAATGVRLVVTLARQLRDIGARWGVASACIGGGQGIALLVENLQAGNI